MSALRKYPDNPPEKALLDAEADERRVDALPHPALPTLDLEHERPRQDELAPRAEGLSKTTALDSAPQHSATDDAVHFDVAARALNVSRKTVERMVKRGELTREVAGVGAAVTKRSLVAQMERRKAPGNIDLERSVPAQLPLGDGAGDPRGLLGPLLDEVVESRVSTEFYKRELSLMEDRASARSYRDELLTVLVAGSRRERRRARRIAIIELLKQRDESA